jgi:hypothetical protein
MLLLQKKVERRLSTDFAPIFAGILYFGSGFRSAAAKDRLLGHFHQKRNNTLSYLVHVRLAIS